MLQARTRGVGKIELIVALACGVILVVVVLMVMRATRPGSVWHQRDALQMQGIHQSMLVFARQFGGVMPRPGLIVRQGDIPGRGAEDPRHNNTAALYSAMVMQNYLTPNVLVSSSEPNPNVQVHEYNWEGYNPQGGRFWDRTFQADLSRMSHVSYAHMFMFGERFDRYWRETPGANVPVLGNRGPADGERDANSYTTISGGRWTGYVIGGDNSAQLQTGMTPSWLTFVHEGAQKSDNLFALDDSLGGIDVVLTFTRNTTATGADRHHD